MLHQRLAGIRKSNGLTQQELADKLNISRATYAQYEIGRREPDFETLQKLADFFSTTTDYLLGRTDEPSPPKDDGIPQEDKILLRLLKQLPPESAEKFMKIRKENTKMLTEWAEEIKRNQNKEK